MQRPRTIDLAIRSSPSLDRRGRRGCLGYFIVFVFIRLYSLGITPHCNGALEVILYVRILTIDGEKMTGSSVQSVH